MKTLTTLAIGATFGLLTFGAMAEDGKKCDKSERHAARKAEILKKFDADGSGDLSEDERKAARAAFAKKRRGAAGKRGPCKKGQCDKKKEDAPQGT